MTRLVVDLCGYWITGSGTGRGFLVDRGSARDGNGLPYLPGRHLRGLLRNAVRHAAAMGMARAANATPWPPDLERVLFGGEGRTGVYRDRATGLRSAGLLDIRDALLPSDERAYFATHPDALQALTRTLHQTAMMSERGIARSRSLRVSEVFVPMRLEAEIGLLPLFDETSPDEQAVAAGWREIVGGILCLIDAVGGGRNHGLGRATLSLCDAPARTDRAA